MQRYPVDIERNFARTAIRQRGGWLAAELAVLKRHVGEDSIHDTRVQSRRMRAALEAFQDLFPPREWQEVYDSVRKITRALGAIRETKVMLVLLQELTSEQEIAEALCREHLEERLQKKLNRLESRLKRRVREINLRAMRSRISHLLNGSGESQVQPEKDAAAPAPPPRDRRLLVLRSLAQPILDFRTSYQFPRASDDRLHKLRIAAKKLRYTMELFDPQSPGGLKKEIAAARALQDAAGQHQDWAVLKRYLQKQIRRFARHQRRYLASYTEHLLARAEENKAALRAALLPAIVDLQQHMKALFEIDGPSRSAEVPAKVE